MTTELSGTFSCPICAWPEPHAHGAKEIAQRPYIDGAREAFERWGIEREEADRPWERFYYLGGASLSTPMRGRWTPSGPYTNPQVELAWQVWRDAWITRGKIAAAIFSGYCGGEK